MDPGYQNVMDFSNVVPTALALGIHVAMAFAQLSLAGFLVARPRSVLVQCDSC